MSKEGTATRIIALMNQKGGVGKTTSTVNLGAGLVELGYRVLLIDLDPQAHLTMHVGVDPESLSRSIYDLMTDDEVGFEDVVQEAGEGLYLLPAEVDLAGAGTELVSKANRLTVLRDKVGKHAEGYDFVLMDCPPSLGVLTLNGLVLAREVIVPLQAHFLALQGVSKLLETIQMVRAELNPHLVVSGVVLCVHDAQTNLAREVVSDLENFFESSRKMSMPWSNAVVYQPPIRRNIKLAECPSFGQTIFEYAGWCPGAVDYRRLACAVSGVPWNEAGGDENGERGENVRPDAEVQEGGEESDEGHGGDGGGQEAGPEIHVVGESGEHEEVVRRDDDVTSL